MKKSSSFLKWASACFGNLFEHYDSALYGFLLPFLAPLLFPKEDLIVALIYAYAIIPLGMLVRPLGALFFGYLGDTYGRQYALSLSLFGMAIVSGGMACCPTYAQIGIGVPIFFMFGRVFQNFCSAGESMGGAIFLLENTHASKQDLYSGIYNASTIGGILLASMGVSLVVQADFLAVGWRFLYLFGCLTAFFGWLMRCRLPPEELPVNRLPFKHHIQRFGMVFTENWTSLLLIMVGSGLSYVTYSIALVLMNGFVPLVSKYSNTDMANLNLWLLIIDFCLLPLFGWFSSIFSRERMMLVASTTLALTVIPIVALLENGSYQTIVVVRTSLVLLGVAYCAPFNAWALHLVSKEHRYIVLSFGYALGSQLIGGPASSISLWMYKSTGYVSSVVWYLAAVALLNVLALGLLSQKISPANPSIPAETK